MAGANPLRWNGRPGRYEVYYLTLTDPASGVGLWIRYTLEAPLVGDPSCALWFAAMDPAGEVFARKQTLPIAELSADQDPFRLRIDGAELSDRAASGEFEDVSWDLQWEPGRTYQPVPAPLRPFASTVLVLATGDTAVSGRCQFAGRTLELEGARGGQTHLWGAKHAQSWSWARCSDFRSESGEPIKDTFIDGSPRTCDASGARSALRSCSPGGSMARISAPARCGRATRPSDRMAGASLQRPADGG